MDPISIEMFTSNTYLDPSFNDHLFGQGAVSEEAIHSNELLLVYHCWLTLSVNTYKD